MAEQIAEIILSDKRDSIEVSRNAKGEYSWKAKRYYNAEDTSYATIVAELANINAALNGNFG